MRFIKMAVVSVTALFLGFSTNLWADEADSMSPLQEASLDAPAAKPAQAVKERQAALLEQATGEELSSATGHFARSRSLLIAAVREFDEGYKLVNPSSLMDVKNWRSDVINRAEDLERLLDPQPRASRTGVKYSADTRLLGEAKK